MQSEYRCPHSITVNYVVLWFIDTNKSFTELFLFKYTYIERCLCHLIFCIINVLPYIKK